VQSKVYLLNYKNVCPDEQGALFKILMYIQYIFYIYTTQEFMSICKMRILCIKVARLHIYNM